MELWIRSQDKQKLCIAHSFELDNDKTGIFCNNVDGDYVFAGKYKSKERALEVLDEIQKYINNNCEFIEQKTHTKMGTYTNKIDTNVYEMPSE